MSAENRMGLAEILLDRAAGFIPVLLSLTVHEWAHAWTAWRLGDDTARMMGRVSLNPIDHIDPVGTLLLPLLGVPFGWAKPVPVNPTRFRSSISMPVGMLIVAAAGPISNFVLAVLGCVALVIATSLQTTLLAAGLSPQMFVALSYILQTIVIINVLLACFNLLPIPPLDGSRIVDGLVQGRMRVLWERFTALGPILLIALIVVPNLLGINLLAWPLYLVTELLNRITG